MGIARVRCSEQLTFSEPNDQAPTVFKALMCCLSPGDKWEPTDTGLVICSGSHFRPEKAGDRAWLLQLNGEGREGRRGEGGEGGKGGRRLTGEGRIPWGQTPQALALGQKYTTPNWGGKVAEHQKSDRLVLKSGLSLQARWSWVSCYPFWASFPSSIKWLKSVLTYWSVVKTSSIADLRTWPSTINIWPRPCLAEEEYDLSVSECMWGCAWK